MLLLLSGILRIFPIFGTIKNESFPPVLSSKDEFNYLIKHKNGDKNARDKLIIHNLRLVAHIAKKYENNKIERDDLLSIGMIGLTKAVDTFKVESNNKLGTYAARCIDNEILMVLRKGKNKKNIIWSHLYNGSDAYGNEMRLIDSVKDDSVDIEDKIVLDSRIHLLKNSLHILNKRELTILKYRYGLLNTIPLTQKEIASLLKISRSYVSRIEKRALSKLYYHMKSED